MGFKDRFKDIAPLPNVSSFAAEVIAEPVKEPYFDILLTKLSDKISGIPVWFEYSEYEKNSLVKTFLETYLKDSDITMNEEEKTNLVSQLSETVYGFGELDLLLSDGSISALIAAEGKPVFTERNGILSEAEVKIDKFSLLIDKLQKLSGITSHKPVVKFSYRHLIITLILPPVSRPYIYIKKKNRETTDFDYLLQSSKIDEKIYSLLISLVKDNKNILITGKSDCGKSSYVEAFMGVIPESVLVQETQSINRESFVCGGLSQDEIEDILCVVCRKTADYMIFDMNNGYAPENCNAVISTLRADCPLNAVSKFAANLSARMKLTEKQAKAMLVSSFDYIIHLDKDLFISSVAKLSLSKTGSPVITEIINLDEDI